MIDRLVELGSKKIDEKSNLEGFLFEFGGMCIG